MMWSISHRAESAECRREWETPPRHLESTHPVKSEWFSEPAANGPLCAPQIKEKSVIWPTGYFGV
jgi:hypothetical protein